MKPIRIAKTAEGETLLSSWYDKFYESLPFEKTTERVETSFGHTEVVRAGPQGGAPCVILHGAAAGSAMALTELTTLVERRSVLAVNIPGQSPRAAAVRLSFKDGEYARWLSEVLDHYGLSSPSVLGISFGGSVALQLARHAPERVGGLVLVVPGSIVNGPVLRGFRRIGWPMLRYAMRPTEENRDRALAGLCTNHDPMWTPYLGDMLRVFNTDFSVPPLFKPADLAELRARVFVVGADEDLSFPGGPMLARAAEIFPNLVGTHLLSGTRHVPSFHPDDRASLGQLLLDALDAVEPGARPAESAA